MSLRSRAAVLAIAPLLLLGAPAYAAEGSAPITAPDRVTTQEGALKVVDVLANDTDADGDELVVCRMGDLPDGLEVVSGDLVGKDPRSLAIFAGRPGTYAITYYACDFDYLTPGTLTVVVAKAPRIKVSVTKLAQRPGHLKVVNRSGFPVRFLWGSADERKPDGNVRVVRKAVITVQRRSIVWYAGSRRTADLDFGMVRGIALPEGSEVLPPGAPSGNGGLENLQRTWR